MEGGMLACQHDRGLHILLMFATFNTVQCAPTSVATLHLHNSCRSYCRQVSRNLYIATSLALISAHNIDIIIDINACPKQHVLAMLSFSSWLQGA